MFKAVQLRIRSSPQIPLACTILSDISQYVPIISNGDLVRHCIDFASQALKLAASGLTPVQGCVWISFGHL